MIYIIYKVVCIRLNKITKKNKSCVTIVHVYFFNDCYNYSLLVVHYLVHFNLSLREIFVLKNRLYIT